MDAWQQGKLDLGKAETADLPKELQELKEPERKRYVETRAVERTKLQERIKRLNEERAGDLANQAKNDPGTNTLDAAMITTIREQAAARNYQFK